MEWIINIYYFVKYNVYEKFDVLNDIIFGLIFVFMVMSKSMCCVRMLIFINLKC